MGSTPENLQKAWMQCTPEEKTAFFNWIATNATRRTIDHEPETLNTRRIKKAWFMATRQEGQRFIDWIAKVGVWPPSVIRAAKGEAVHHVDEDRS